MVYDEVRFRGILSQTSDYAASRKWESEFGFAEADVIGYQLCLHIFGLMLLLKQECYAAESEYRILRLNPSEDECKTDDNNGRRYVEMGLRPEHISAIVLGPHCQTSETEMRALLNSTLYKHIEVTRSKLSFGLAGA